MSRGQNIILALAIIALNFTLIFYSGMEEYSLFSINAVFLVIIMIVEARLLFQFTNKETAYGEKHKENLFNLILVLLGFSPIITTFIIALEDNGFLQLPFIFIIVIMGLLVIYLVIAYTTVSITRESDRILGDYYWIRKREIKYQDIDEVYINKYVNAIVLKDVEGNKIYIDMMITDLHLILNELYRKVEKDMTKKLFTTLETFYKSALLKVNLEQLDAYTEKDSN